MSALDPTVRIADSPGASAERPAAAAVAAAVLLHAAFLLLLLLDWHHPPSAEVPVMVATLVQVPPPPAAPPAPAAAQPPQPLTARASGADDKTTAAPRAEVLAPTPETPPTAEATVTPPAPVEPAPNPAADAPPAPSVAAATPEPTPHPTPKEAPQKPKPVAAHAEPRKEQVASRGPMPPLEDRALGEREETGDPYLNAMWTRIEEQRAPTTPIGSSGLHLEGVATWEMLLDRSGTVETLELVRSSGSELLDAEARRMIVAAAPFPPVPGEFPDRTAIKVTIRLFPR